MEELPTISSHELHAYSTEDGPIYLAIKGIIYDVTKSKHLYGPGGPYHIFAGRECARALALFSLSEKDCVNDLYRLDEEELAALEEWIQKFRRKYPIVGRVCDSLFQRLASFLFSNISALR